MGGLLALLLLGVIVAAAGSTSSSPAKSLPAEQNGPFHWHVVTGGKQKFYFEEIGTSYDGYPLLQCPFCETEYVKRP